MSSVLRPVRKRKKVRTLGPVDVIDREEYAELDVDTKVELIRSLVPLGLMHVEELLDAEVTALAGARYARKDASVGGRRVPHPVPWTHICAMPPGVAHTPRAPRSAFDTQASRDARSGCTAPRSRPRRRGRPRGSERFGRGSLAP